MTYLYHDASFNCLLEKCRYCGASLSEFADVAHVHTYAAYVRGRMYVSSVRNPHSLLRCRASCWAVDCAARRALSLTLRLASCVSLSSALSKAQFLHSCSLLRLSPASLLSCASMCRSRSKVDLIGVKHGLSAAGINIIRINQDVDHLRNYRITE